MENKKIMAFVLTGALASGTIGAGSTVYAVGDSTDYVLTIPATLAVENAGWNATEGITAKVKEGDTFDSTKKLKVTASSGDSWALEAEGVTKSIGYNLAAATGTYSSTAEAASWEFSADELNAESGAGTKKAMGIIVEDYSTMPAGNYQDTVTFTATVESAEVPVTGVSLNKSSISLFTISSLGESTDTLVATISPDNATINTVSWTSDNLDVATVDDDGNITAVSTGSATITATAGEKKANCTVLVNCVATPGRSSTNYLICPGASESNPVYFTGKVTTTVTSENVAYNHGLDGSYDVLYFNGVRFYTGNWAVPGMLKITGGTGTAGDPYVLDN